MPAAFRTVLPRRIAALPGPRFRAGDLCQGPGSGLLTLARARVEGGLQGFFRQAHARRHEGARAMAKPTTIKIRLNSTAGTGHFYVTKKNARTMTEKMTVRKYDPVVRQHVEYKEGKIK